MKASTNALNGDQVNLEISKFLDFKIEPAYSSLGANPLENRLPGAEEFIAVKKRDNEKKII